MEELKANSEIALVSEMAVLGKLNDSLLNIDIAAMPKDSRIEDLEGMLPLRRRFRGNYMTSNETDFCEYVNSHAEENCAAVFVDPEGMTASAHLALGNKKTPLHNDHTAILTPQPLQAFVACTGMHQRTVNQRELLEWIEDWREHITGTSACAVNDNDMTAHQVMAAIRRVKINASATATHEDGPMSAKQSLMASVEATSTEGALPEYLHFVCTPYPHFAEATFDLAVTVKPAGEEGKAPSFRLRIRMLETHKEMIAREFADRIKERVTAAPVRIGNFND